MEANQLKTAILALFGDIIGPQPISGSGIARDLLAMPNGFAVKDMEGYQIRPSRTRGKTSIHEYPAFVAYVNDFKTLGNTRIFVSSTLDFKQGGILATAYLDYPKLSETSWATHSADLVVSQSLEYKMLTDLDCKFFAQDVFARELRKIAGLCTSMPGADLLELAQTIQLTSKGSFRSISDDFSGSVNFLYDLKVGASAGTETKKLDVPQAFTFELPLLLGGKAVSLTTEFAYRVPAEAGGSVTLGLRIVDRLFIERDVLQSTAAALNGDTNCPVAVGDTDVPESDYTD